MSRLSATESSIKLIHDLGGTHTPTFYGFHAILIKSPNRNGWGGRGVAAEKGNVRTRLEMGYGKYVDAHTDHRLVVNVVNVINESLLFSITFNLLIGRFAVTSYQLSLVVMAGRQQD